MNKVYLFNDFKNLTQEYSELDKHEYFFQIWTLKESYLKQLGIGLIDDLESISFEYKNKIWKEKNNDDSIFFQTKISNDYYLSICTKTKNSIMKFIDLTEIL